MLAEIGQAHEGSMSIAMSLMELAALSGADGAKVQVHLPQFESTLDEPFRTNPETGDSSRYAYWDRTSFSLEQWAALRKHAEELGILFIPSVFSLDALRAMNELGVDGWKVGSAEVLESWFVDAVVDLKQPTIFSSGMSSWGNIEKLRHAATALPYAAILQCTSKYPTPLHEIGIDIIEKIQRELGVNSGLSDHSGSTSPSLLALSRGAQIIEVHVTPHRGMRGFDTTSSLTFEELRTITAFRDDLEHLAGRTTSKDELSFELEPLKQVFGRSIAPRIPIPAGTVITSEMLAFKKPAGGFAPSELDKVTGRVAKNALDPQRIIRPEDLR